MNQRAAPYVLTLDQARSHRGTFPPVKAGAADRRPAHGERGGAGPGTPGPPLHIHEDTDECFYVVEGRLLIQVGEDRHELGPGCFAWLPGRSRTPSPMSPPARCVCSG